MLVTLDGIMIEVNAEQIPKASMPMLVTLDGIEMDVNLLQPKKADWPMVVNPVK